MNELEILLPDNWPALRRRLAEVDPPPVALDQEAWGMPYSWQEESPGASDCQKAEQIDFKCRTQASLLQLRRIRCTLSLRGGPRGRRGNPSFWRPGLRRRDSLFAKNPGKKQPGPRPWTRGPAAVRFRWPARPESAQGSVRPMPLVDRAAAPAAHAPPRLESSCGSTGA